MNDCALRLTAFEPVTDILIRVERRADGWSLWCRHAHYAGTLSDCVPLEVTKLSDEELLAVLDAHVAGLGARPVLP